MIPLKITKPVQEVEIPKDSETKQLNKFGIQDTRLFVLSQQQYCCCK